MPDLISLAEYKTYKTVTSDTKDDKLNALITGVSALIESHCGRVFSVTEYTEYHDAKNNLVILKNFPVTEVTSVSTSEDGGITQVTLTEAATDKTGYFADLENGWVMTQISTRKFLEYYDVAYRSLEIVYSAGYAIIPEDLKLATIDLVDYYKDDEHKPALAMGASSMDNPLPYSSNRFPAHIQRVLDIYRYAP